MNLEICEFIYFKKKINSNCESQNFDQIKLVNSSVRVLFVLKTKLNL